MLNKFALTNSYFLHLKVEFFDILIPCLNSAYQLSSPGPISSAPRHTAERFAGAHK